MPKATFFNLPKEKQKRIIDAAIDEFAARPFHQARVTAIADQAGIPAGSFYQYFEDKKDLYKYLISLIAHEKVSFVNQELVEKKEECGFFGLLREAYLSSIRFAKAHPRFVPIGIMLFSDKELYHEIFGEYADRGVEFFKELLEQGKREGSVDPSIDTTLVANVLIGIHFVLADFIIEDGKLDYDDMVVIDQVLDLVENGIKKRD
ncbi:MAG: TetR/AcrR family transcriptional regulator [Bacillota bacterium]|nr:TetR/AcrR family transcriptional regulator [Bacillota bacterium]HOB91853.1 TetR/AcrR family transcriptional regulator [Bacillota bacterium]HPZ55051.1 TetR/AcrR family transcriptional regulator [Bacillota bacterium]HQD19013.1 TetR/AcrR family transcriptional regulator [Bacillota bacterium]